MKTNRSMNTILVKGWDKTDNKEKTRLDLKKLSTTKSLSVMYQTFHFFLNRYFVIVCFVKYIPDS